MARERAVERPNILVVMTDQQRYDSLGCYGIDWVKTPNLDRLASQGVVFDNCYATNPICTPSRASLFTGKQLPGHGVYKLHDILPEDEICFTRRLQQRGYHTALFGKMHVSGRIYEEAQRHPNDGFDVYEWCLEAMLSMDSPLNGYAPWLKQQDPQFHDRLKAEGRRLLHHPRELHMTHWAAERTIDYIRSAAKDRPFFCKMSVFDPHNPYEDYPLEMLELVDEKRIPPPLKRPAGEMRPQGIMSERNHSYLGGFDRFTREDLHKMRIGYFASIALFDLEVGRVLEELEQSGTGAEHPGDHDQRSRGHAGGSGAAGKGGLLLRSLREDPPDPALARSHPSRQTKFRAGADPRSGRHGPGRRRFSAREASAVDARSHGPGPGRRAEKAAMTTRSAATATAASAIRGWPGTRRSTAPCSGTGASSSMSTTGSGSVNCTTCRKIPQELNNRWDHPDYREVQLDLTKQLVEWMFHQELGNDARGGEALPDPRKRLVNALK